MAVNRMRWIWVSLATGVVLVAALAVFAMHRYAVKKRVEAETAAAVEKSFKELEEKSVAVEHEKEALAMTKKQLAGRKAELQKEIAKLKELITFLEQ